jgi:drug/metabolite transporter (DMT)-like permease
MPIWIIIALLAGLASNLANFLFRYLLKDGDDTTSYAWFHQAFRFAFFFWMALFNFRLELGVQSFLALTLLGAAEFIAGLILMKMHAYSHLSISTIISRTRLIWVPIIAFFLFHETLKASEYIGILTLFLGLSIAVSPRKILADKGITFAYLSAFTIALVNIALKNATPHASIPVIMVFAALPSMIALPVCMKNGLARITTSFKINMPLKIITGLVSAGSMYFLTLAISLGPVSKVTALYQGMMIASVLAGIIFLKETEDMGKKIIGSAISIIGVILLTT